MWRPTDSRKGEDTPTARLEVRGRFVPVSDDADVDSEGRFVPVSEDDEDDDGFDDEER